MTRLDKGRYTLFIVPGVDSRTDDITLMGIQHFTGVLLVRIVVLAEDKRDEPAVTADDRKRVDLVVPEDIICLAEGHALGSGDDLVDGGHKGRYLCGGSHTADAVIAAGDNTHEPAAGRSIVCDRDSGVSGPFLERQNVHQRGVRADIGIAGNKSSLVALRAGDHGRLVLYRLGTVNKGNTAALSERDRQTVAGNRLHDCGNHGNRELNGRLFTLAVFYERSFQRNVCRHAFTG